MLWTNRLRRNLARDHRRHRLHKIAKALFRTGNGGHGGDAKIARKAADIDLHTFALSLVHEIYTDDNFTRNFKHLQHKIQVSLECGGVYHNDRAIGPPKQQEVAANLLVLRGGEK